MKTKKGERIANSRLQNTRKAGSNSSNITIEYRCRLVSTPFLFLGLDQCAVDTYWHVLVQWQQQRYGEIVITCTFA